MDTNTIGKRIKDAQILAGLTQVDLAKMHGLGGVSGWETGRTEPNVRSGHKLSKALNVTPAWLFFGVGAGPAI